MSRAAVFVGALLMIAVCAAARAAAPVVLVPGFDRAATAGKIEAAVGVDPKLGADAVLSGALDAAFRPTPDDATHFGRGPGVVWLRIRLRNDGDAPVSGALMVRFPYLVEVTFFTPDGGSRLVETRAGAAEPRSPRALASHFPAARFLLPARSEVAALVRLRSVGVVMAPVLVLSDAAYDRMMRRDGLLIGAALGLSAALTIYALAVWRAVREPALLAFAAFCAAAGAYGAASMGVASVWLGPLAHVDGVAVFLSASGALYAASGWFLDAFLRGARRAPKAMVLLRCVSVVGIAGMATPWLPSWCALWLFGALVGPCALAVLALTLKRWRDGAREGRDATIGWVALQSAAAFLYLRVFDITPYAPINHYLGPLSCALASLWFAWALAARMRRTEARLAELERWRTDHATFFAGMSHDLRTPLNGVIGLATLLKLRPPDAISREERDARLDQIRASGEHMLALVNRILDISKLDADAWRIQPAPCELSEIARDCVSMAAPLAERARVRLRQETHAYAAPVSGDRHALTQALMNLLSNAIKFSEPGDTVVVALHAEPGWARLSVTDQGPGIAPEEIPRVLEPYGQAGDAAHRRMGTGLGLPMARRMAELHGGALTLRSRPGRGLTAVLSLPLADCAAARALVSELADPEPTRPAARA
jgi:signal transduction histidine kinase